MKLLLDQNLSPRLCEHLADLDITIVHVRSVGLEAADDSQVWDHAAQHEFMIITKDADFIKPGVSLWAAAEGGLDSQRKLFDTRHRESTASATVGASHLWG